MAKESELIATIAVVLAQEYNRAPNETDLEFARKFVLAYRAVKEIEGSNKGKGATTNQY